MVAGAVAGEVRQRHRGERREVLQPGRDAGQADDVAMRAGDRSHAHGVGHALAVRLAVAGEAEHRLDQRLELQGGADDAVEHDGLVAGVPELVGGAGLDDGTLAALEPDALATDPQLEGALDRGEGLGLAGMHVGGGDEAAGLHDGDDLDVLAVGRGGGLEERQLLTGHAVDEGVSGVDHDPLLSVGVAAGCCTTDAARAHVRAA